MATVGFVPRSPTGDLQIVFAAETWNAAARVARMYELIAEILRFSTEAKCNRFFIRGEGPEELGCGVCIRFENAPVAVLLWADLAQAMPLLDRIEEAVRGQVRLVKASGGRISEREIQIVAMSADGMTSAEIGLLCGLAETTVNAHIARAMRRIKARNRSHLIATAIRNGYI